MDIQGYTRHLSCPHDTSGYCSRCAALQAGFTDPFGDVSSTLEDDITHAQCWFIPFVTGFIAGVLCLTVSVYLCHLL